MALPIYFSPRHKLRRIRLKFILLPSVRAAPLDVPPPPFPIQCHFHFRFPQSAGTAKCSVPSRPQVNARSDPSSPQRHCQKSIVSLCLLQLTIAVADPCLSASKAAKIFFLLTDNSRTFPNLRGDFPQLNCLCLLLISRKQFDQRPIIAQQSQPFVQSIECHAHNSPVINFPYVKNVARFSKICNTFLTCHALTRISFHCSPTGPPGHSQQFDNPALCRCYHWLLLIVCLKMPLPKLFRTQH